MWYVRQIRVNAWKKKQHREEKYEMLAAGL